MAFHIQTPSIDRTAGLGSAIGGGLGKLLERHQQQKASKQALGGLAPLFKEAGLGDQDIEQLVNSGLDPQLAIKALEGYQKVKNQKSQEKYNFKEALTTLDDMENLVEFAGPSNFISSLFGGETTEKRAELAQLGTSLIPLVAAGVPIRNQREFEQYKKIITDPNARQADIKGAITGLRRIFNRSLGKEGQQASSGEESQDQFVKMKGPDGVVRNIPRDQAISAQKAGGTLVR